jgi:hypothetical protein
MNTLAIVVFLSALLTIVGATHINMQQNKAITNLIDRINCLERDGVYVGDGFCVNQPKQ